MDERKEEKGGVDDSGRNAGSEKKLNEQRRADAALGACPPRQKIRGLEWVLALGGAGSFHPLVSLGAQLT